MPTRKFKRKVFVSYSRHGYYGDEDSFIDLIKAGAVVPTGNVVVPVELGVRLAAEKLGSCRYTEELVRQFSSS